MNANQRKALGLPYIPDCPIYGVVYARLTPPMEFDTLREAVKFAKAINYGAVWELPVEGMLWEELNHNDLAKRLGAYKQGQRI